RQEENGQVAKVLANGPGDAGILHFDGDLLAGAEPRAMHVAERRGREGSLFKPIEKILWIVAEFVPDHLAQECPVHGRRLVMQAVQRFIKFRRNMWRELAQG